MNSRGDKPFPEREKQSLSSQQEEAAAAKVAALLERASVLHAVGQLPEAETLYREVLQASPNHPNALHLLGVIAYQVGQSATALQLIDAAIQVRPEFWEAYFSRGNAQYALQQYPAAVESYSKAIQLHAGFAEAYNNRGGSLNALEQYQAALEDYDQAVLLKPDYPEAYCNRGNALCALEQYQAALESLDKAIELKPDYADAHSNRANVLQALQQYVVALQSYDKAILLDPTNAEAHNNRGSALHALKQYEAALESFDKAIELKPDYADAHNNRENTQAGLVQYLYFRPDYEYQKERQVFEVVVKEAARIAKIQDKAQMKSELDALPLDIRSHPAISNLRNLNFSKTESSGKDLVFYCSPPNETWNPETARTKGVGGSEEAIIWLSRLLHERGWSVTVYGNCGLEEKEYDGVLWKPYWTWNCRDKQDITVIWRHPQYVSDEINSDAVIVDLHDVVFEERFTAKRLQKIDKIFVKSKFHRSLFPHIPDEKFVILPNGIDAKLFEGEANRDPLLMINTSSADRSLAAFVDCVEAIKKQVPQARAQWAYGWGVWDLNDTVVERVAFKAKLVQRMKAVGVEDLGRLSHGDVAQLYRKANIFAYPSEMAEIDCISLSKAMAAGAIPITTDFGALGEKSGHGGVFLHSKKTKDDWIQPGQFHYEITDPEQKAQFVEEAVKLLLTPPVEKEREPMREWARSTFDWNAIADAWNEELGVLLRSPGSEDGSLGRLPGDGRMKTFRP